MADLSAAPRKTRDWIAPAVLVALLALVPPISLALDDPFLVKVAMRVVVFAIVAVALDLVVGFGGLVSLCHAGLLGVGGYVVAILAFHDFNAEPIFGLLPGTSNLAVTLPLGALTAALVAVVVGAISLRTSGPYFIMITLAFNQMFYYAAVALQKYGGEDGLQIMSAITLGPLDVSNRYRFFYVALAGLALTLLVITRMASSRFGIILRAAAANETRVVAVGVAPWAYRLVAFTVSGFFAGMAGALLAASQQFISPVDMAWDRSGDFVVMAVLGGVATVWGPVVGAAAFIVLELVLSSWSQHWHLAFGLLILMVVIFLRGGLADLAHVFRPRAAGGGHG